MKRFFLICSTVVSTLAVLALGLDHLRSPGIDNVIAVTVRSRQDMKQLKHALAAVTHERIQRDTAAAGAASVSIVAGGAESAHPDESGSVAQVRNALAQIPSASLDARRAQLAILSDTDRPDREISAIAYMEITRTDVMNADAAPGELLGYVAAAHHLLLLSTPDPQESLEHTIGAINAQKDPDIRAHLVVQFSVYHPHLRAVLMGELQKSRIEMPGIL